MAANRVFADAEITLDVLVPSGTLSGDPVVYGQMPGVALIDRMSDGRATIQRDGVFNLSVSATGAIAEGDILYFHSGSTPKVNNVSSAGIRFGYAAGAVADGNTSTIPVVIGV